jgi:alkanesulfonate monooxygenase SsuD/methylene tetrahydromethanopterin reductase-like flavin-dependent oxidoreductase (luciferase family)
VEEERMTADGTPRHPVTFGVVTGQHQYTWPQLVEQWQLAEELGFDSVWLFDHFLALYGDPDGPCLEASTLLAALALKTSRVRIGVLVYGNTHRHPAILAKEMVTVDHLSGGRAILGIGTGWNEREHAAYAIPFPSAGDRVAMLDEALTAIESLFTEQRTNYEGRFYQLRDAPFAPKPVQAKLPIMVGGKRPKMLKVIARHADLWDSGPTPDELRQRRAELARNCEEIGREPEEIVCSVSLGADRLEDERGFADLVRAYRAAGASQFLFDFPISAAGIATAERVARTVIPGLREELGVRRQASAGR